MGMFIKFTCDNCGEYDCDCPIELRNKNSKIETKIHEPAESVNGLVKGDIICSGITKDGKAINQRYIEKIEKGKIYLCEIHGNNIKEWDGKEKLIKICSVIAN